MRVRTLALVVSCAMIATLSSAASPSEEDSLLANPCLLQELVCENNRLPLGSLGVQADHPCLDGAEFDELKNELKYGSAFRAEPIRLVQRSWDSHNLLSSIAGTVLQELMGYRVEHVALPNMRSIPYAIAGGLATIDFEMWDRTFFTVALQRGLGPSLFAASPCTP